jgi:hypothetical protein
MLTAQHRPQPRSAEVISPRPSLANTSTSSSPSPEGGTPFWYGNEDSDHVKNVMDIYCRAINCSDSLRRVEILSVCRSRQPPAFVGRIKRLHVPALAMSPQCCRRATSISSRSAGVFQTVDEVTVCVREPMTLQGEHFPVAKVHHYISVWDEDDGVPVSQEAISEAECEPAFPANAFPLSPLPRVCS